jgi:hypothetical protein
MHMTLHEAIEKLLRQEKRPMTTGEIAVALNRNQWYVKKDSSPITAFQIHGRTRKYETLFRREGSMVFLQNNGSHSTTIKRTRTKSENTAKAILKPVSLTPAVAESEVDKKLMEETYFRSVPEAFASIPHEPGLYALRLKKGSRLPAVFQGHLNRRGHNLLYIGIASQSLYTRLMQELRAKGHGTFFRSLGAMLGYQPPRGSLVHKANKRNFRFAPADEQEIIEWIDQHLLLNWICRQGNLDSLEARLIGQHLPLVNIDKNPAALQEIRELRAACVSVANEE